MRCCRERHWAECGVDWRDSAQSRDGLPSESTQSVHLCSTTCVRRARDPTYLWYPEWACSIVSRWRPWTSHRPLIVMVPTCPCPLPVGGTTSGQKPRQRPQAPLPNPPSGPQLASGHFEQAIPCSGLGFLIHKKRILGTSSNLVLMNCRVKT